MFITFEGGEGSGKTTLIKMLAEELKGLGKDVVVTREPGGSKIAEQIRTVLLKNDNTEITIQTEALLFAAARAQHLNEVIIPNINKLILCDRYIDSSFAYQAYGRGLGMDFVCRVNTYALDHLPDLTFYIDLDPTIGINRVNKGRTHKKDRLDTETSEFHLKVRSGYLEIAKQFKERFVVINGNRTIEVIYEEILERIKSSL